MVDYKEFKVGDLFDVNPTKYYKGLRDDEVKTKDGTIPFVTTQNTNNGVAGYSNLSAINKGNTITASDTTGDDAIFYQESDFIGRSHVQNITPKKDVTFNKHIALYIISCIKQSVHGLYDYGNKFNRQNMKNTSILLPVTSEGTPDYSYMESYIREMQREYIDSLLESNSIERNHLLKVVGLSNDEYERIKDHVVLSDAKRYAEFSIDDLFVMESISQIPQGWLPKFIDCGVTYISQKIGNNGFNGYIEPTTALKLNKGGVIVVGVDKIAEGVIYWQEEDFYANKMLKLSSGHVNKNSALYVVSCIKKVCEPIYSYSNKINIDKLKNTKILLPITTTGEVDYAYMEDYISKIKLIYIYNRELSVNEQVRLLESLITEKELVETK